MIPGQPGKGRRHLVPPSPVRVTPRAACLTSSSGRSRVRSVLTNEELCGQAGSETPPSRIRRTGGFDRSAHTVTQRVTVATVQTRTSAGPGGFTPPEGLPRGRTATRSGATESEAGVAKPVHPLPPGRREKPRGPGCNPTQLESQEVRPVTQGQRPANRRSRPCGKDGDAHALQAYSPSRPASRSRQGASTRAQRPHSTDPGRQRPGRSRHETETSACRGEWRRGAHGPRKRERLTCVSGKERAANAHPPSWPRSRSGSGASCFHLDPP